MTKFSVARLARMLVACALPALLPAVSLAQMEAAPAHEPELSGRAFAPLPDPSQGTAVTRWLLMSDRLLLGLPAPLVTAAVIVAMHDALNAIEPRYARWAPPAPDEPPAAGAAPQVAVAMAAFGVLAAVHPPFVMRAEAEPLLREALRGVPGDGLAAGLALGGAIAQATLARLARPAESVPFRSGEAPGQWRPTPPLGILGQVTLVAPILFDSRAALRGAPPPALDSPRYLRDLEEVRRVGGAGSTTRTPEQSAIAGFWAAQSGQRGFMHLALRELAAMPRAGGIWDEARALSAMAVALSDSAVFAWEEKRFHAHWRPITAINAGGPGVAADPDWQPMLPTPAHPDYPSGHAADCAAGATILASIFGSPTRPVEYIAMEPVERPARRYPDYAAAAVECADSRVWAGAHFQFANDEGLRIGAAVAQRAMERVQPR